MTTLTLAKLAEIEAAAAKATPGQRAVVDGHYPAFKELDGLSFKVSVVMFATDLTEKDYQARNADLSFLAFCDPATVAALCNAYRERDALQAQVAELITGLHTEQERTHRFLDRAEKAEVERDDFYSDYRMKCDKETKVLHVECDELRAERDALAAQLTGYDAARELLNVQDNKIDTLRAVLDVARSCIYSLDAREIYADELDRIDAALAGKDAT